MDAVTGLMEALKTGGPYAMAAIFIVGWLLERQDRREKETQMRAVYEKTVTLVQETTKTVGRMEAAVTALTDAIRSINGRLRS
jgi:hypothetical protein